LAVPVKHEKLCGTVKLSAESSVNEVKEKDTNWRKLLEILPWISRQQPLSFWKMAQPRAQAAGWVTG